MKCGRNFLLVCAVVGFWTQSGLAQTYSGSNASNTVTETAKAIGAVLNAFNKALDTAVQSQATNAIAAESLTMIDPAFNNLVQLHKSSPEIVRDYRLKFQTPVSPLGGLGCVPWGAGFEDVVLGGDMESGSITYIQNYQTQYALLASSAKTENEKLEGRQALHEQQSQLLKQNNSALQPAGLKTLPNFGIVSGTNRDGAISYMFADDKLYAVSISPHDSPLADDKTIVEGQQETIEVYTRALSAKYGKPDVSTKQITVPVIGELECINMTWKNEAGTAVMTLLPMNRVTADIGRAALELGQITANMYIDSSEAGGTMIGEGAKWLTGVASQSVEDWFKEFEKQYQLTSITYYSNKAVENSPQREAVFEQQKARDETIKRENKEKEWDKKADRILDRI
jgi:hypothetical protein